MFFFPLFLSFFFLFQVYISSHSLSLVVYQSLVPSGSCICGIKRLTNNSHQYYVVCYVHDWQNSWRLAQPVMSTELVLPTEKLGTFNSSQMYQLLLKSTLRLKRIHQIPWPSGSKRLYFWTAFSLWFCV